MQLFLSQYSVLIELQIQIGQLKIFETSYPIIHKKISWFQAWGQSIIENIEPFLYITEKRVCSEFKT